MNALHEYIYSINWCLRESGPPVHALPIQKTSKITRGDSAWFLLLNRNGRPHSRFALAFVFIRISDHSSYIHCGPMKVSSNIGNAAVRVLLLCRVADRLSEHAPAQSIHPPHTLRICLILYLCTVR